METPVVITPKIIEHHLDETISLLQGTTKEYLTTLNQWAAVGLDQYHQNSKATFEFQIDGESLSKILNWNSNFEKGAMREKKHIAEQGGVSLAFFVMTVLLGYRQVQQSEIGEGVDYGFQKEPRNDENFFAHCHYIEASGILDETPSNTLRRRIRVKHNQIGKGTRNREVSSIIITHFRQPVTIKQRHR